MSFEAVRHPFPSGFAPEVFGIALSFKFVDRLLLIQEKAVAGRKKIMTWSFYLIIFNKINLQNSTIPPTKGRERVVIQ
jgi:hypothetical protein